MKLIIQINCLNEELSLPEAIRELPKKIKGIDVIEYLVVDDGSNDSTSKVAKKLGVHHIIRHNQNRGLPSAVNTGMKYALENGADIVVNTDADNQYKGSDIARLVEPIVLQEADYVYGERQIDTIDEFSFVKKQFQYAGAWVVSQILGFSIQDAASGFRAISKETAARLFLLSDFASPLESLIQTKMKGLGISVVPITTNETKRPSRLVKSIPSYVSKSAVIILDNVLIYRPLYIFLSLSIASFTSGTIIAISRILLIWGGSNSNHFTLFAIALILILVGFQFLIFALSARLQRALRIQNDEILYRQNLK